MLLDRPPTWERSQLLVNRLSAKHLSPRPVHLASHHSQRVSLVKLNSSRQLPRSVSPHSQERPLLVSPHSRQQMLLDSFRSHQRALLASLRNKQRAPSANLRNQQQAPLASLRNRQRTPLDSLHNQQRIPLVNPRHQPQIHSAKPHSQQRMPLASLPNQQLRAPSPSHRPLEAQQQHQLNQHSEHLRSDNNKRSQLSGRVLNLLRHLDRPRNILQGLAQLLLKHQQPQGSAIRREVSKEAYSKVRESTRIPRTATL